MQLAALVDVARQEVVLDSGVRVQHRDVLKHLQDGRIFPSCSFAHDGGGYILPRR